MEKFTIFLRNIPQVKGCIDIITIIGNLQTFIRAKDISITISKKTIKLQCNIKEENRQEFINHIIYWRIKDDGFNELFEGMEYEGSTNQTNQL